MFFYVLPRFAAGRGWRPVDSALGAGAALDQALRAGAVTLGCWGKAEGRFQEVARVATRRLDGIPLAWLENR